MQLASVPYTHIGSQSAYWSLMARPTSNQLINLILSQPQNEWKQIGDTRQPKQS